MTHRLYYDDSYRKEFRATVLDTYEDRCRVVLDRSAFYPSSGGQPHDLGSINGIAVTNVEETDGQIIHTLAGPLGGEIVDCQIDWPRRFDHMQQHSGQHILSAVIAELFGYPTVAFHMGAEVSTIEFEAASLNAQTLRDVEQRAHQIVWENRPLTVSYQDAAVATGLRKESERQGLLRIVSIHGLDRSACGGTHVRSTGEIGAISVRKTEKLRGHTRVEFLCGSRAALRARADYETLVAVAKRFSTSLDDAPAAVATCAARLQESEKIRQRLVAELAQIKGRQLYHDTPMDGSGQRRVWRLLPAGSVIEETRWEAQSFTAQPKSVFLATSEDAASIMLAVSPDSGLHAGEWLKAQLVKAGGKGGGNAVLAQGSVTDPQRLYEISKALNFEKPV